MDEGGHGVLGLLGKRKDLNEWMEVTLDPKSYQISVVSCFVHIIFHLLRLHFHLFNTQRSPWNPTLWSAPVREVFFTSSLCIWMWMSCPVLLCSVLALVRWLWWDWVASRCPLSFVVFCLLQLSFLLLQNNYCIPLEDMAHRTSPFNLDCKRACCQRESLTYRHIRRAATF